MKETKRTIRFFKFYNRSGMQSYLEEMAAEGWLLTKSTELFWHFRRIEPAKLHFSVVYFPGASIYDAEASEKQEQFHDLCAHTGWELAASNGKLQFFYNDAENPVPIETDAVFEVENIHKSVKKQFLPGYYWELFFSLLNLVFLTTQYRMDPLIFLASGGSLLYFLSWTLVGILSLAEILRYTFWYKKARKSAETENHFKEPNGHPEYMLFIIPILLFGIGVFLADKLDRSVAVASAFAIAGCTLFIGLFGAFLFFATIRLLKNRKTATKVTRTVSHVVLWFGCFLMFVLLAGALTKFLFETPTRKSRETAVSYEYNGHTFYIYQDTIPFTISDLTQTDYTEYSRRCSTKSSFLLSYLEASERPRYDALSEPELNYHILQIKAPFLYEHCLEAMLADFAHNYGTPAPESPDREQALSVPAAPWGANKAYRLSIGDELQNRFLLCYDTAIVEIDFDWEADDAAIEKIKSTVTSVLSASAN